MVTSRFLFDCSKMLNIPGWKGIINNSRHASRGKLKEKMFAAADIHKAGIRFTSHVLQSPEDVDLLFINMGQCTHNRIKAAARVSM